MNPLGYLTIAVLLLVAVGAVYIAAGARRTHDADVAWQRQSDQFVMARLAERADYLAAEGYRHPGTAAITEYEQRQVDAE
jgi:Tfp pilus assembly protein PilW